jgi:hypothetical protein
VGIATVMASKFSDSINNISDTDIWPGSDVCPSCKSDVWKSASKVVMEGTTNTKSTITGTVTDAGKFNGGVRELLLSDRWFSWDYPIEADIGLIPSTGLVQNVKRFMVEYGQEVKMPSLPPEPKLSKSIMDAWKVILENPEPILPQAPTESKPPEIVKKPEMAGKSTVTSKLVQFLITIVSSIFGLIGINAAFGSNTLTVQSAFIIFPSVIIFVTVKFLNRKTKIEEENKMKDIENWPETLEQYQKDRETFQEEIERFRIRYEESERKLSEYNKVIEETACYEKQLAEYETRKNDVLKMREQLWEQARICVQCGTAYLGIG